MEGMARRPPSEPDISALFQHHLTELLSERYCKVLALFRFGYPLRNRVGDHSRRNPPSESSGWSL